MDNRFDQFKKGINKLISPKTNAVIYTRVSTKEQADNNASLATQMKHCKKYTEENGLNIVEYFGGTYESAKNDERKEFQKMLSFVKQRKSIGFVIVYSYDRFSRSGPSGAFISHELKQKGIQVVSATQSVDYNDPSGNFMEGIYHLFSQFDNQLRRDKSMTGMTEKLKQGFWPFAPPTGYDNLNQGKTADKHKLVINDKGKLLKKAFEWKAKQDLSLVEIARRLNARGWNIPPKRLTHFFRNPFYCGYIDSSMVPGEMIDGKHVPLITKKTFLKVHENLSKFHSGYNISLETDHLPLKQFVKCDCCGTSMVGYTVKKKGLHYYKCNKTGCKKNRSQKVLHQKFEELLTRFKCPEELKETMKKMLLYVLSKEINTAPSDTKALKIELAYLRKKLEATEERFVLGEINQKLYEKFRNKFSLKIEQIQAEMSNSKNSLSNLEKAAENALEIASKLPHMWRSGKFNTKRKLQNLMFPEGIRYDRENDNYRTTRTNFLFSLIACLSEEYGGKKDGDFINFDKIPTLVGPHGLEPWTP